MFVPFPFIGPIVGTLQTKKAARTLCKSIYPKSQLILWPWSKRCQNILLTLALVLEKILILSIILSLNFADNRFSFLGQPALCVASHSVVCRVL